MKRFKLCSVALTAFTLLLLTSCLGDSSSEMNFVDLPGSARFEGNKVVVETAVGTVYAPNLLATGFSADDCMLISFQYDSEDPANDGSLQNSYVTVTLTANPTSVSKRNVSFYNIDTTTVQTGERALDYGDYSHNAQYFGYLNGYLFMTSAYSGKAEEKLSWTLFFDRDQTPVKVKGSDVKGVEKEYNEYKAYLRCIVESEGTGTATNRAVINAYDAKDMIDLLNMKEKSLGNEGYFLNIQHVEKITESDSLIWKASETPIPMSIPEE